MYTTPQIRESLNGCAEIAGCCTVEAFGSVFSTGLCGGNVGPVSTGDPRPFPTCQIEGTPCVITIGPVTISGNPPS